MRKPLLRSVGSAVINVFRREPDTYSYGELVKGDELVIPIRCNIQQSTYSQTMFLPESERSKEYVTVYSGETLRPLKEGVGGWAADEFVWNGERYRVIKQVRYDMGVLDHTQTLAVRIERTPN